MYGKKKPTVTNIEAERFLRAVFQETHPPTHLGHFVDVDDGRNLAIIRSFTDALTIRAQFPLHIWMKRTLLTYVIFNSS